MFFLSFIFYSVGVWRQPEATTIITPKNKVLMVLLIVLVATYSNPHVAGAMLPRIAALVS